MSSDIEMDSICKQMQEKALNATKCSLAIRSWDHNYLNTSHKFNQILKHENNECLEMLSSLIQNEYKGKRIEKMVVDEDKSDLITELNDNIFDKIGNYLDEALGLKQKEADLVLATVGADNKTSVNSCTTSSWNRHIIRAKRGVNCKLLSAKVVERSQMRFKDKIDNSNHPFVPIIKEKANSIRPLAILPEKTELGFDSYSHPYEVEIEKFEPKEHFLQIEIPEFPKPLSETPFKYITTIEDLIELCKDLKTCDVIAVDLEHHSYRTFQGFTCLMQISTKTCDYVIDTIELRSELNLLNEVFTCASILKVFHGADMDVVWLQRDFGIYIVNLFDTFHASKLLDFSHLSLSFLLKHYCNLEADKQFQLADWRIRPLTPELLKYAREDTHYLIFIYTQMKNQLIAAGNNEKNLLKAVFERSKNVCLKKYEKPLHNSESYRSLLKKCKVNFNSRQMFALKELYDWRDRMARNEDESTGYVLPNHMLLHMAEVLPREQQGILASCNPVPPLVKQQLNEIHLIILKARDRPITKSDEKVTKQSNIDRFANRVIDLDEQIDSKHDKFAADSDINTKPLIEQFEDKEFCELQESANEEPLKKCSQFIDFFNNKTQPIRCKTVENISSSFISQFERYNLTIGRQNDIKPEENGKIADKVMKKLKK
ncbi:unnamed protein product [Medioppia subpectinata]|uniref:Exosome complex component 10 homolog n=1 Tax=Medioppia subpectinata TaxID=1979941 RepID=A0A7R9Q7T3_9ACAR|nr:unnamed protein product [Medioppia subpectinata]CAG2116164.1 unnamed protein product [Medioppia subpectinata]